MGLLDILNGMQNGPRGQATPAPAGSSGGMSPIAMALLGLVAYKAIKHLSPDQQPNAVPAGPAGRGTTAAAGPSAGGLGGMLGPLGGLLAGGSAGSVLSGGLNDLLKQFQQGGQTDVVQSWIGTGPNKSISPDVLSKILSPDQIRTLTAHTGMSRDELITSLSQQLPELVNQLTPNGRIPNEREASRLI
jgi:uncharacterized protein YidB (DUF937 family)